MTRARAALSALAATAVLAAPAAAQTPTATTGTPPPASSPAATTPATTPATTTPGKQPAARSSGTGDRGWLIALAAVLGVLALGVLGWGLARAFAWQPRRLAGARHAVGEAAYRTGSTWAELRDWLRLGR